MFDGHQEAVLNTMKGSGCLMTSAILVSVTSLFVFEALQYKLTGCFLKRIGQPGRILAQTVNIKLNSLGYLKVLERGGGGWLVIC